jgi:hypothetical protein
VAVHALLALGMDIDQQGSVLLTQCAPSLAPKAGAPRPANKFHPQTHLEDIDFAILADEEDGEGSDSDEQGDGHDSFVSIQFQYLTILHLEPQPWSIVFWVPLPSGAFDMLSLLSNSRWDTVRFVIAEMMDVSVNSLDIDYKFSTHVNHEPFCVLSSATHWLECFSEVT